ncbi:MAG: aldo/keto reductase [Lewinella sp.]|nr:aldo/keto reductase [Lewinella sp.]
MHYRTLADTDLSVSVIAFGAWAAGGWMWGGADRRAAIAAIRAAYEEGVTSIDTAPVYGQGESEEIVGQAIRELPRDRVQIMTKFGLRWDQVNGQFYFDSRNNRGQSIDIYKYAGPDSIIEEVEHSLRRLGTDYIDLYQIHWPDPTTPIQDTFEAVARLIEQGKVRYAGVCNYSKAQLQEADQYVNIVSDQVPFSMVKRDIEDELVPYTRTAGKAILAYSPLQRGLLTGKMQPGQAFSPGDHRATHPSFTDESIRRTNAFLEAIRPLADAKGATLAQLVLKWTIERPGITVALAGARNAEQAVQNARAAALSLSPAEIEHINEALERW